MVSKLHVILWIVFSWDMLYAAPASFSYQGRIVKSAGAPLVHNSVKFNFQILSPDGTCVIYEEEVSGIDMSNSGGVFDTPIGSGLRLFPSSGVFTVLDSVNNAVTLNCKNASTYAPTASDGRKLHVEFHDGTGWKTITPDTEIRSVPFAGFAQSSALLGSHPATDFLLKSVLPTCTTGTYLSWNGTSLSCAALGGVIQADDGTDAAPGITFASDTNTGIYAPAADMIAISAGGARKVEISNWNTFFFNDVYLNGSSPYAYNTSGSTSGPPLYALFINNNVLGDNYGSMVQFQANNTANQNQRAYIGAVAVTSGNTPNIVIGQQTGLNSYQERIRIDVNGNVGIGTTVPTAPLHVYTANTSGNIASFLSGSGGCSIAYNGASCSSDSRLKEKVQTVRGEEMLRDLLSVRSVHFNWIKDPQHQKQTGFIAQELQKIFPEFVSTDASGYLQVNYGSFVSVLTAAIQELNHRTEQKAATVRVELDAVNARLSALEKRLDEKDRLLRLKTEEVETLKKKLAH